MAGRGRACPPVTRAAKAYSKKPAFAMALAGAATDMGTDMGEEALTFSCSLITDLPVFSMRILADTWQVFYMGGAEF